MMEIPIFILHLAFTFDKKDLNKNISLILFCILQYNWHTINYLFEKTTKKTRTQLH